MPKLWELSEEMRSLSSQIDEVIEAEIEDSEKNTRLEELLSEVLKTEENFEKKVEVIAVYIRQLELLAEAREKEAKRISELAKQAKNQSVSLRRYLTIQCLNAGKSKIETTIAKISIHPNRPKVEILNLEQIPSQFLRVKTEPDLKAIGQHLKENPDCPFAKISSDGHFLQIR